MAFQQHKTVHYYYPTIKVDCNITISITSSLSLFSSFVPFHYDGGVASPQGQRLSPGRLLGDSRPNLHRCHLLRRGLHY